MKAIQTKYFGPTNCRGSRIKASDDDGNTVTVPYDYGSENPHREAAVALIHEMGWNPVSIVQGQLKDGDVLVLLNTFSYRVGADDAEYKILSDSVIPVD